MKKFGIFYIKEKLTEGNSMKSLTKNGPMVGQMIGCICEVKI
jgi:hypothetical protein